MFSAALKDIVIVVRSQHNGYHVKKAKAMREDLTRQAEAMGEKVWKCSSASRVLTCRPRRIVLPIIAYTRRLRPKEVPLSGLRVGISLVDVYERVRKSVISVCKKAQRANRCILWVWKSWENVLVCDLFILTVHLQELKECKVREGDTRLCSKENWRDPSGCSETVKSRMSSVWFVWKLWDFLVARGQKLGSRGHWALLEHSPEVPLKVHEMDSFSCNLPTKKLTVKYLMASIISWLVMCKQ